MALRLLPPVPPEEHAFPVSKEPTFAFKRTKQGYGPSGVWGFDVWLMRGRDGTNLSFQHDGGFQRTLAAAKAWAREYAAVREMAYVEWVEPPPPTAQELRLQEVRRKRGLVRLYDEQALAAEGGASAAMHSIAGMEDVPAAMSPHPRAAAEAWQRGAAVSAELVRLHTGYAVAHASNAIARIDAAIANLELWREELAQVKPTIGLAVVRESEVE